MFDEQKIRYFLQDAIDNWQFPGCSLGVYYNNIEHYICCGRLTYSPYSPQVSLRTYYDLASLTKPLGTTLCLMNLVSKGLVSLDDKLSKFFSDVSQEKADITIKNLLTHTSGFQAIPEIWKCGERERDKLEKFLLETSLEFLPGTKTLYSDAGFILLGFIIEKVSGLGLDLAIKKYVFDALNVNELIFNPFFPKIFIAPTQFNHELGRFMWGEVDDKNARFLGGIAGHAGLFGTTKGVLELLRNILLAFYEKRHFDGFPSDLIKNFTKRASIDPNSSWALGFDTPTEVNSTSGRYFSADSVGHLGYTGTSFWMDLKREIIVVFLSNRVFPVNTEFNKENMRKFRMNLHDLIMSMLIR